VGLLAAGGAFEVTLEHIRLAGAGLGLFRIICNDRLALTVTNILISKSRDYLSFLNAQWHSGSCQLLSQCIPVKYNLVLCVPLTGGSL
jgi:hypothetical protein